MTRSRRHTPITGTAIAESEKWDKQKANRRLRHRVKQVLAADAEVEVLPERREVSNVWSFMKDGKTYWGNKKWWDKDWFSKLWRK
jgi:hypothetical protein